MRIEFINIPGTTSLIKSDDLIYSRLQAKVIKHREILPPESSEDNFSITTTEEIVFSIQSEYHSVVNVENNKSEDSDTVIHDVKDEVCKIIANVETIVFNSDSVALVDYPSYLLLDNETREKVDSWIKYFRRNVKWHERLTEMREEQAEEIRRNNLAMEEIRDLVLSKPTGTTFDSKIDILVQNINEDTEKHNKRIKLISKHLIGPDEIVYQTSNAYEICEWLRTNVDDSQVTFDKINYGIAIWVNFIKELLLGSHSNIKSAYGLNFISEQDNKSIDDYESLNVSTNQALDEGLDTDINDTEDNKNLSLEEEADLTSKSDRPYTIKIDKSDERSINM